MVTVTKRFRFESCHHLPYYEGACHNLHGHSYHLDVTVGGRVEKDINNPKCGMIMDFKDLKKIVNEKVVDKFDHSNLNDIYVNPTAELMVKDIATTIRSGLPKGIHLVNVKLWETEDSYAEWSIYDELYEVYESLQYLKEGLRPAT